MTTDLLDFPPIVPPTTEVAAPAPKMLTVAEFVRAQFASHEPVLTMLATKHRADKVVIGTKTTDNAKSLTAAKAIRAELREQGRFAVQRALDGLKKELNGAKGIAEAEAARLIAIVQPVEKVYDDAIKAEEDRIEAERQAELERQRIRREGFQNAIRAILEYQRAAAGLPAERIQRGLEKLALMEFDAEHWAEFLGEAKQAHAETLDALRKMHADAVERERLEAENARLRAEAEERARVERERQQEESKRIQRENDEAAALRTSLVPADPAPVVHATVESALIAAAEMRKPWAVHLTAAEPATINDGSPTREEVRRAVELLASRHEAQQAERVEPVSVQQPEPHDLACIKLGDINFAIGKGFTMNSEFAEQVLGVPGERVKASYCYTAAGRRALLEALVERIQKVM